jgi:hypothetical protein
VRSGGVSGDERIRCGTVSTLIIVVSQTMLIEMVRSDVYMDVFRADTRDGKGNG